MAQKHQPTYDERCAELADYFLEDEGGLSAPRYINELAAEIQATVENFIERERQNLEPPDPPGFEGGFADNH
jgi:hypothetical protein